MIVSQINHGKANDSNNGIPDNTDNIASLPTVENHISNSHRVLDCTSQNCQSKNNPDWFAAIGNDKTLATIGIRNDKIMH